MRGERRGREDRMQSDCSHIQAPVGAEDAFLNPSLLTVWWL